MLRHCRTPTRRRRAVDALPAVRAALLVEPDAEEVVELATADALGGRDQVCRSALRPLLPGKRSTYACPVETAASGHFEAFLAEWVLELLPAGRVPALAII